LRISFIFRNFSRFCSIKTIVSSAYYIIETPPSTRWGMSPSTWVVFLSTNYQ
jgi:hypothetical protein